MKEFESILDDCLERMASGASTLDECLLRYPDQAHQLQPLLQSGIRLGRFSDLQPSLAFKGRVRSQLVAQMLSHPHGWQGKSSFFRLAVSMAVLVLAFLFAGTAFAQSALPGEPFYGWKLASESAWRVFSPDPLGTDLALADRRVAEMVVVADDPVRLSRALEGYREILNRLNSEENEDVLNRVLPVLQSHQLILSQAGLSVPGLDVHVRDFTEPEITPIAPPHATSSPIPEAPILYTPMPETPIIPEILPTVHGPIIPKPTIEIPPPIR